MIILGIDPGTRKAGYGVVEVDGSDERLLDFGVITLDARKSHPYRLKCLYDRVTAVIEEHLPDECALEMPVYGQNPQSMLKLGRAQAAAMLAVLNRGIPAEQYTPKEVKKSVTGNGNASKEQVAYMVRSMLAIPEQKKLGLDAADALAVALCHAHRATPEGPATYSGWGSFLRANPDRVR